MADRPFESGQQIKHVEGCPGCIYGTTFGSRHLEDCPYDEEHQIATMADEGCPNVDVVE